MNLCLQIFPPYIIILNYFLIYTHVCMCVYIYIYIYIYIYHRPKIEKKYIYIIGLK